MTLDQIGDSEKDMSPINTNNDMPAPTNNIDVTHEEDMSPIPDQTMPNKIKGGEDGTTAALRLLGAGKKYGE